MIYQPNWYVVFSAVITVASLYRILHYVLCNISRYQNVKPARQQYIAKNIIKGIYLFFLTLYTLPYGYDAIFRDIWPNKTIQTISFLYAVPDFVGLILVPSLHWMTKIHHCLVIFLTVSSMWRNFTHNYWQWQVTYGLLSMFAWPVNLFLGAWRLFSLEHYRQFSAAVAFMNYISCLLINWSWQIWHLLKYAPEIDSYGGYLEMFFGSFILFLIAADDILLVQGLLNHIRTKKMLKH